MQPRSCNRFLFRHLLYLNLFLNILTGKFGSKVGESRIKSCSHASVGHPVLVRHPVDLASVSPTSRPTQSIAATGRILFARRRFSHLFNHFTTSQLFQSRRKLRSDTWI